LADKRRHRHGCGSTDHHPQHRTRERCPRCCGPQGSRDGQAGDRDQDDQEDSSRAGQRAEHAQERDQATDQETAGRGQRGLSGPGLVNFVEAQLVTGMRRQGIAFAELDGDLFGQPAR
jgi:hypothetical protein